MNDPTGASSRAVTNLCELLDIDPDVVRGVVAGLAARRWTIAAAESLTAGLFVAALTEIPGASAVVRGGIVCYATDLKSSLVGVDAQLLQRVGPVHPDVACQLARGARERCGASMGIGLTGVAGPDRQGGQAPGTAYVARSGSGGDAVAAVPVDEATVTRWSVRAAAVRAGIELVADAVR